jgi:hypothetical protein
VKIKVGVWCMNCDIKKLVRRMVIVLGLAPITVIVAMKKSDDKWPFPAPPAEWSDGQDAKEGDAAYQSQSSQPPARGIPAFGTDTPWPAIAYAVKNKKTDRVGQLLGQGQDPNWQTSMGLTLLAMATNNGDVETAKLLVQAKADLDTDYQEGSTIIANRGDWNGTTVLMRAAHAGNVELVNLFISAGASVNRRDMCRGTALNGAVASNNPAIVQALLAAGAIVRTEDVEIAERAAVSTGNHDIITLLQNAPLRQRSFILLAKQAIKSPTLLPALAAASCFAVHFGRLIIRSVAAQDGACDALQCALNIR